MATWGSRLASESGLSSVLQSGRDAKLLFVQRFVRLFAYGASFLILVPFLAELGVSDAHAGLFMTLTLLGDVLISVLLTGITDRIGRRLVLAAGAVLMATSGIVFVLASNFWVLLLASVVGVISPSGNEIGPFRAVEESILAHLTDSTQRSDIFAWYTLGGTAGTALGSLACGWLVQAMQDHGLSSLAAYRVVFSVYAANGLLKCLLTSLLSPAVELEPVQSDDAAGEMGNDEDELELGERAGFLAKGADDHGDGVGNGNGDGDDDSTGSPTGSSSERPFHRAGIEPPQSKAKAIISWVGSFFPTISPESRQILRRLLLLFALDSFGSGMASASWITYFFISVHSLAPGVLGTLFLVTNMVATFSNLLALPLARRLGPLKTMVFTHLPSTIFLALVPIPRPSKHFGTPLAMTFLVLRACTQSMDQAPRQAFLAAAVLPAERTAVMGVVNMVKTLTQAGGVGFSGVLAGRHLWIPLLSGAGTLKAAYDLLLLWSFTHLRSRDG